MATPSFGEKLKQQRERRNTSIEDIAERTQIALRFLQALEKDEFDQLPGRAFGKFYIRAYAEILDFDPEPLIVEYDRQQADAEGATVEATPPEPPKLRRVEAEIARWREARQAGQRASTDAERDGDTEDVGPVADRESKADEDVSIPEPELEPEPVPEFDLEEMQVGGARFDEAAALASILGAKETASTSSRRRRVILLSVSGVFLLVVLGWAWVSLRGPDRGVDEVRTSAPDNGLVATVPEVSSESSIVETIEEPTPLAPTPAPPPESDRAVVRDSPAITVSEFGVGRQIVNRRLEGQARSFEEGSVVWFQTRVVGGGRGETVRHVWIRDGRAVQTVDLELGGSHWRTHSRKTLWGTGPWAVEARDRSGRVLARSEFVCVPAD